MNRYLCLVLYLSAIVSAIFAKKESTLNANGLPIVGETFGPLTTAWPDATIYPEFETFKVKAEMFGRLKLEATENSVMVKIDPSVLEGKYVEVLTSKAIASDEVKLVCHSYMVDPAFCHTLAGSAEVKATYSTVKPVGGENLIPVVFFNHRVCDTSNSCGWFTHVSEYVLLNKSVV